MAADIYRKLSNSTLPNIHDQTPFLFVLEISVVALTGKITIRITRGGGKGHCLPFFSVSGWMFFPWDIQRVRLYPLDKQSSRGALRLKNGWTAVDSRDRIMIESCYTNAWLMVLPGNKIRWYQTVVYTQNMDKGWMYICLGMKTSCLKNGNHLHKDTQVGLSTPTLTQT